MFRIGEFSKIAQVSGRLLRYYDEIGLLSPEFTDPETGYRYYSAQQLPQLNRILVLKELGLSLEQITKLVQHTSADELRGMLTLRKAQIEQSLQDELVRLRVVETRLQQIDTHGTVQEPDVILKAVPLQSFLSVRQILPDIAAVRHCVQSIAAFVPSKIGQSSLGPMAAILHSPIYDPEAFDLEIGYLLVGKAPESLQMPPERVLSRRKLPAIATMATLIHVGAVTEVHLTYSLLAQWIEQNGWRIDGEPRDLLLQLPVPGKTEEAVFEIQFPVTKVDRQKP
jgi:DNA-binding transcriptional MerR regulator